MPADVAVALARSALGIIPVVGPIAAEIVGAIIPGQRVDRIQRFLEKLAQRVDGIEETMIRDKMSQPESIDLLEDCLQGASRALSDNRLQYLANLYATGITSEQADHETNKKMASLLSQLTDAEVIWLGELAQIRAVLDWPEGNLDVLYPRSAAMRSSAAEVDAAEIQKAWKDRLIQLGLANARLRKSMRDGSIEIDMITNDWERDEPEATWLGRMLLGYIGIDEPIRGRRLDRNESIE